MKKLLHPTKIGLPEKLRIELITMLNKSLASTMDLYAMLKQAHWNLKGPEFIALHKLLDDIAEDLEEHIDTLAERVTSLGGTALGTLQQAVKNSSLDAYPIDIFSAKQHLEHLTHNIAVLAELVREDLDATDELNDMGTNDIYIDLSRFLEKNLWLLEAHLQK